MIISVIMSFFYFLAAMFGIEWAMAEEKCISRYGTNYEAKEGYEIPGYDEYDFNYYCCPKYSNNRYGECEYLDY